MRSARALPGFRSFVWSVRSRVARSIARRVATRDTTRRTPSRPVDRPDRHERDRTSLKARVREPENADGGGSHASVYAGGLRVTHPRLCPCLCRSDLRRRPCRTRQPLSGPSSPPWSSPRRPSRASRPSARSPRKEGFALLLCSPNARRARGVRRRFSNAFSNVFRAKTKKNKISDYLPTRTPFCVF